MFHPAVSAEVRKSRYAVLLSLCQYEFAMKNPLLFFALLLTAVPARAQTPVFYNHQDSLRGYLFPERACYDVKHYDLDISFSRVNPSDENMPLDQLQGSVGFLVQNVADYNRLQFDLFERFSVDSILWQDRKLRFEREGNAVFILFPANQRAGRQNSFRVYYHGTGLVAKRAPWDGGFSYAKDQNGRPWIGVSCEGLGASSWWPNKDHLSEEPDSMTLRYTIPEGLMVVGNGRLFSREIKDKKETFVWKVNNPINNYNVTVNIGDYVHFTDDYTDASGQVRTLNYYVLRGNEVRAIEHFQQVKPMLSCFESKMGPYAFWEDGYALVETPYWGMEHQSAIAYGNNYKNNKYGFDFIIVHESGHEWFGNSISVADHADMWIHEGFCTYSETMFMECIRGKAAAYDYINGQRRNIRNQKPMIGPYEVNYAVADNDIYFKGAWIIHSLRNSLNDDARFYDLMRDFNRDFFKKTTRTEEVIQWWAKHTDARYEATLRQYLFQSNLPILEYKLKGRGKERKLSYRFAGVGQDFYLPITVETRQKSVTLSPDTDWQEITLTFQKGEKPALSFGDYLLKTEEVK